jgi:uridine kinase
MKKEITITISGKPGSGRTIVQGLIRKALSKESAVCIIQEAGRGEQEHQIKIDFDAEQHIENKLRYQFPK